jgi:hypothetical protein
LQCGADSRIHPPYHYHCGEKPPRWKTIMYEWSNGK